MTIVLLCRTLVRHFLSLFFLVIAQKYGYFEKCASRIQYVAPRFRVYRDGQRSNS